MKRRAFVRRLGAGVLACALLRDALLGGAPEVGGPLGMVGVVDTHRAATLEDLNAAFRDIYGPGIRASIQREFELIQAFDRASGIPEHLLVGERLVARMPR